MVTALAPLELLERARRGETVDAESIAELVRRWLADEVSDAQMAAWCMAVCIRGLDAEHTAALTAAKQGDPRERETDVGPLSSQVAADRLEDQVQRAVAQGATVVAGGKRNGNYFEPTVLTDITPENDVYREELFGPVAQVYRVQSEDEAVTLANDTPFGLGSYLMTNDPEQAERVADRIDAGMVYVNIVGADGAELPFGGTKRSGFGRELGRYGADEFVNKKLIRIG